MTTLVNLVTAAVEGIDHLLDFTIHVFTDLARRESGE